MEIVTGTPAPTQEPNVARETLLELAAVVRTIFGVGLQAPAAMEQPVPASAGVTPSEPIATPAPLAAVPALSMPVPAVVALDMLDPPDAPALAGPRTPVPEMAPAAIPVPSIPVPAVTPENSQDHDSPGERHSLALLQEIAFLDD